MDTGTIRGGNPFEILLTEGKRTCPECGATMRLACDNPPPVASSPRARKDSPPRGPDFDEPKPIAAADPIPHMTSIDWRCPDCGRAEIAGQLDPNVGVHWFVTPESDEESNG